MRLPVKLGLVLLAAVLVLVALRHAGPALVVNAPRHSDVILVLAGDSDDKRYWKAMSLFRSGYARQLMVDARADGISYGRTPAEMAQDFIQRTAGDLSGRVAVCPTTGDSTMLELKSADACLARAAPRSVLVVTSDYHTRRALSIARHQLPRYSWTAAAADNGLLSLPQWWRDRTVAKDVFMEWQKLAWWEVVERHR